MTFARAATLALGVALLASVACTAKLSLEGRACPCTDGYACCEANNECVPDDVDLKTCGTRPPKRQSTIDDLPTTSVRAGIEIAKASNPVCFTTDDDAVYWVNRDGTIGAVRTSDGPPVAIQRFLVPASSVTACGMARAGGHLFVTLETGASILRLSVRADASGGLSLGDSADRIGTFEQPIALAASDETTVFVAERKSQKIKRLDVATSATVDVTMSSREVRQLVVTNGALVWSEGAVVTRSTEPGSALHYLAGGSSATDLVVRDGRVFFLDGNSLWSAPLSGETQARRETGPFDAESPNSKLVGITAYAFDGPNVVTAVHDRIFYEASFEGRRPRALFGMQASTAEGPRFLHVDAKRYLWASSTGIWSASRPLEP